MTLPPSNTPIAHKTRSSQSPMDTDSPVYGNTTELPHNLQELWSKLESAGITDPDQLQQLINASQTQKTNPTFDREIQTTLALNSIQPIKAKNSLDSPPDLWYFVRHLGTKVVLDYPFKPAVSFFRDSLMSSGKFDVVTYLDHYEWSSLDIQEKTPAIMRVILSKYATISNLNMWVLASWTRLVVSL